MIRQLVTHTAAYTFANLASRGTVLIWLIVLPAFLSPADYGALGLILTTAALVNVLVPLEVSQGLARFYPGAPETQRRAWAATAWTFTLIMLGAAAVGALAAAPWLNRRLLGAGEYLPVFRIAILYFVLNASFFFVQNQFRWAFRARDYTVVTLIFAALTLMLSIGLAAILPDALFGVLIGLTLGLLFGLLLGLYLLGDAIGLRIDPARLARMLRFSLPLVPASVALFLGTYASRFILNDLLSLSEVGQFTWASQLAAIPALLLLGVQGAITPLVMKRHDEPGTAALLARSFEGIVVAELWLCLALGLFTPQFVSLLGYKSYAGAGPLVMVLAPAYVMLQLYVFSPGFAIAERTRLQLGVSLATAAAAVALNYWLIGAFGLIGGAIATLGSSAVFLGSWFLISSRFYPVPIHWLKLAAFVIAAMLCAVVARGIDTAGWWEDIGIKVLLLTLLGAAALVLGFVKPGHFKTMLAWRAAPGGSAS